MQGHARHREAAGAALPLPLAAPRVGGNGPAALAWACGRLSA